MQPSGRTQLSVGLSGSAVGVGMPYVIPPPWGFWFGLACLLLALGFMLAAWRETRRDAKGVASAPVPTARLESHLKIVFDPTCQGCRSRLSNAGGPPGVFRICVGVANTADVPAEGVMVYVQTLSVTGLKIPALLRRLEHSGRHEGAMPQLPVEPVTLNPSGDSDHHHFALMVHRHGNMFVELLLGGEPTPVSVEARDLTGEILVSSERSPVKRRFGLDCDQVGTPLLRLE